jgi:hypothetical protein
MSKHLGAGVSSSHSLASDTSEGTRCHVRHKGCKETAISPAGSNARSSHAAAPAMNNETVEITNGQRETSEIIIPQFETK